ncbi:transposase, partial [Salmonella enterica subsp. enterica serovar Montevideo]|nr:transposase [Salmonella enterica subsp. enterica serovar Montevideo]
MGIKFSIKLNGIHHAVHNADPDSLFGVQGCSTDLIRSVESGRTVKDVYREAGISEATRDNWKSGYGGMEASDIKS